MKREPVTTRQPVSSTRIRAFGAIAAHLVVDLFSFVLIPLLSVIEGRFHLTPGQGTGLIVIGSVSSGLVQPIVALLSDRHDTRALGTLGFLLAVVGVGSVGYLQNYAQLVAVQIIATAGIGAFHPVAAAAVGQLLHTRRSRAMACFYTAGMLGGVLGNLLAPRWVAGFGHDAAGVYSPAIGLESLAYLVPFGLIFVALLSWAVHAAPHRHHDAHERHAALSPQERRRRWNAIGLLYVANVLKFAVDNAVIALVKEWSKTLAAAHPDAGLSAADLALRASAISGPLQAAKQVGMGVGGMGLGFLLARRHEKAALIAMPLLGTLALIALPFTGHSPGLSWLICGVAGMGYGATVPLSLSIAQRLLPHRTSLASALMLGGAWSIGSFGASFAQGAAQKWGVEWAFAGAGAAMVAAATSALFLRRSTLELATG
ncbi:MAG TPA: MFS transporter [Phycisphaerales bacterium]|nr:MFS transporter [Phycisphaerales bacterium]